MPIVLATETFRKVAFRVYMRPSKTRLTSNFESVQPLWEGGVCYKE